MDMNKFMNDDALPQLNTRGESSKTAPKPSSMVTVESAKKPTLKFADLYGDNFDNDDQNQNKEYEDDYLPAIEKIDYLTESNPTVIVKPKIEEDKYEVYQDDSLHLRNNESKESKNSKEISLYDDHLDRHTSEFTDLGFSLTFSLCFTFY